ncbi:MAG: hypothetical protein AAGB15_00110 [Pseudomonadota bacterium]
MPKSQDYPGQVLAMVARVLMEKAYDRDGGVLNLTAMITEACMARFTPDAEHPKTSEINRAMSRPAKQPNPVVRAALEAVFDYQLERLGLDDAALDLVEQEAKRRVKEEDYNGQGKQKVYKRPMPGSVSEPGIGAENSNPIHRICQTAAAQLGIRPQANSQKDLKVIAGDYLILRYLFSRNRFVTSYMRIFPPRPTFISGRKYFDHPTWFKTKGGEDVTSNDFSLVRGIVFSPEGNPGSFMSIGQVENQVSLRAAIFSQVSKPKPIRTRASTSSRDLFGLRLSFGSTIVDQVAHRLWCSYLPHNDSGQSLRESSSTYTEEEFDAMYQHHLDGFQVIKDWISAVPTMTIKEYMIEKNGIRVPREPFTYWMNHETDEASEQ